MHMWLPLLQVAYNYYVTPTTEIKSPVESVLSPEDRIIYNKMVTKILAAVSPTRLADLSKGQQSPNRTFVLICCKTHSWKIVEKMFIEALLLPDPNMQQWADRWLGTINQLRGVRRRLVLSSKLVLEEKRKAQPNMQKSDHLRSIISQSRQEITTILTDAKTNLDLERRAFKHLMDDPTCRKILDLLQDKWKHLSVFSKWPEISMDAKGLVFRVHTKWQGVDVKKFLNHPTKAIVTLEEEDFKEVGQEGSKTRIQTQKIQFAEFNTALSRKKMYTPHKNPVPPPRPRKVAVGEDLHRLANFAIEEVNARLKL